MATLAIAAVMAFVAWFAWYYTTSSNEVVVWGVAAFGVAMFAAAFTWTVGNVPDVLDNALLGGFFTLLGGAAFWVRSELPDIIRRRRGR